MSQSPEHRCDPLSWIGAHALPLLSKQLKLPSYVPRRYRADPWQPGSSHIEANFHLKRGENLDIQRHIMPAVIALAEKLDIDAIATARKLRVGLSKLQLVIYQLPRPGQDSGVDYTFAESMGYCLRIFTIYKMAHQPYNFTIDIGYDFERRP